MRREAKCLWQCVSVTTHATLHASVHVTVHATVHGTAHAPDPTTVLVTVNVHVPVDVTVSVPVHVPVHGPVTLILHMYTLLRLIVQDTVHLPYELSKILQQLILYTCHEVRRSLRLSPKQFLVAHVLLYSQRLVWLYRGVLGGGGAEACHIYCPW